jgi:hypothetical protein
VSGLVGGDVLLGLVLQKYWIIRSYQGIFSFEFRMTDTYGTRSQSIIYLESIISKDPPS